MKRIVIIHYHLNPGGVTRIIESQIKSLKKYRPSLQIVVAAGYCENPDQIRSLGAELLIDENLNYLDENNTDPDTEYKSLLGFFNRLFQKEDIIHIHNLNLGKNPLLTLAISEFAQKGYKILNHAHDFAEDRPQNLQFLKHIIENKFGKDLSEVLYPDLPNFFHATLNSFDKRRLIDYGMTEAKVFLLPNPVSFDPGHKQIDGLELKIKLCKQLNLDSGKKLVTYPVRVIRRKNIGEYILLAALLSQEANWLVTQPPKNPVEIIPYDQWKDFCRKEGISLVFEAGLKVDFEELIRASDFCFTTSIKEGFGMVFLEPWLLDTPVVGRDLPHITEDIKKSGIKFPLLYRAIRVPFHDQIVDFSSLAVSDQQTCISNIVRNETFRNLVITKNPFIENLLNFKDKTIMANNKSIINKEYSLLNYAERLEKIYQKFVG